MNDYILAQLEYIVRVLVAGFCGAMIGYERKNKLKEAGIRTHFIVALTSALIIIISKYGFYDILGTPGIGLDPARVAAQVVSGVGFLGAGLIFVRNQSISGLTTAAGMWATSGIGLAIGCGLYLLGIVSSIIILIAQFLLHRSRWWIKLPIAEQLRIKIRNTSDSVTSIEDTLKNDKIDIINMKVNNLDGFFLEVIIYAKLPKGYNKSNLIKLFNDNPLVKTLEI
ncbi:MgtC/SapB family protein [Romboutsia ilealis]|uniref:MgtC/SapB family protein n=1 Tax=Romboutsia faecis TaxID=2764597 RepID=A0ABR7JQJ3_9FIRM|nr:MgtC/SapB family protein [Romboutsia faecis]MBC5997173.1 MgtC/SapB family protein [Romboutsia faecis]MRN23455.1 MgtC/SapB family protein [Romboutsia ilealis]